MNRAGRTPCFVTAAIVVALGIASGCSESPGGPKPDEMGRVDIRVTTKSAAIDADPDGYTVAINTQPSKPISVTGALTIIELPVGAHQLRLEGLAPNCSIDGPAEISVDVIAAGTATAAFSISCVANTGTVRITTVSSGPDAELNAYYVNLPGFSAVRLRANDTITVENVRVGTSGDIVLGGVPVNCAVTSSSLPKLKVEFGATSELAFVVGCETGGTIEITGITTGDDLDENGYRTELTRVGSTTSAYVWTPANGTATVPRLVSGTYELRYSDFLSNCAAVKAPSVVKVVTGTVIQVNVEVNCTAAGRILFVKGSDSDAEIYITKNNQTGEGRITTQPGWDGDPAWSPDGRIVFASERDGGNREIYVMNSDGQNPERLTNSNAADYRPVWSRQGAKIAFVSERDGNAEIYTMNTDGTNPVRLTNNDSYDGDPEWSPDGTRIAFRSNRDGAGIWIMNRDGSGLRRVTSNPLEDWQPAWSPKGDKIAFSRGEVGGKRNIYLVSANGGEVTPVTFDLTNATDPTWSGDGAEIAFGFLSDDCHSYYYAYYGCVPYLLTYRFGRPGNYYLVGAPSFNPDWRK